MPLCNVFTIRKYLPLTTAALLFAAVVTSHSESQAQVTAPRNPGYDQAVSVRQLPRITLQPSDQSNDDSARIQEAIDQASATVSDQNGTQVPGAVVRFASGRYRLRDVVMRSNVYIRCSPLVVFEFSGTGIGSSSTMFSIGNGVTNVSIRGNSNSDRLVVLGPEEAPAFVINRRFRFIALADVNNFEITNVHVENRLSRFCTIFMGPQDGDVRGNVPTQGTVRNYSAAGNNAGFGTIQTHAARRVTFRNIFSEGGVALRMETGIENFSGIRDVFARNISCVDGRAAVFLQPHAIRFHNRIRIETVYTRACAYAVEGHSGFVDRNSRDAGPGFSTPGRFRNVSISNITAEFGTEPTAQVRPQNFRLIATRFWTPIPTAAEELMLERGRNFITIATRPIGVVAVPSGYNLSINRASVRTIDFPADLRTPLLTTSSTPDRNTDSRDHARSFSALIREVENLLN